MEELRLACRSLTIEPISLSKPSAPTPREGAAKIKGKGAVREYNRWSAVWALMLTSSQPVGQNFTKRAGGQLAFSTYPHPPTPSRLDGNAYPVSRRILLFPPYMNFRRRPFLYFAVSWLSSNFFISSPQIFVIHRLCAKPHPGVTGWADLILFRWNWPAFSVKEHILSR